MNTDPPELRAMEEIIDRLKQPHAMTVDEFRDLAQKHAEIASDEVAHKVVFWSAEQRERLLHLNNLFGRWLEKVRSQIQS